MQYRLGPAALAESYLSHERLLAAIEETGAEAVHPGYGFLAENADFARAVVAAGARWIGPAPGGHRADGLEDRGAPDRRRRRRADHPRLRRVAGSGRPRRRGRTRSASRCWSRRPPVAAARASGSCTTPTDSRPRSPRHRARPSAASATAAMIVERYIQRPRHVEVQIVGDRHGNVLHLGTRECSVQRRYQKVLEEAPAPNLPDATRDGLHEAAVSLAAAMRLRLGRHRRVHRRRHDRRVLLPRDEHPAPGRAPGHRGGHRARHRRADDPLGRRTSRCRIAQDDVTFTGHAFECRINAENPANGFTPDIGPIERLRVGYDGGPAHPPTGRFRWDAAVREGDAVTPFYDSMIAKLIVWDDDRAGGARHAARVARRAVDRRCSSRPVRSTAGSSTSSRSSTAVCTTRFLDETADPGRPGRSRRHVDAARGLGQRSDRCPHSVRASSGRFRLTPAPARCPARACARSTANCTRRGRPMGGAGTIVREGWTTPSDAPAPDTWAGGAAPIRAAVDTYDRTSPSRSTAIRTTSPCRTARRSGPARRSAAPPTATPCVAPFPGAVTEVAVEPGQTGRRRRHLHRHRGDEDAPHPDLAGRRHGRRSHRRRRRPGRFPPSTRHVRADRTPPVETSEVPNDPPQHLHDRRTPGDLRPDGRVRRQGGHARTATEWEEEGKVPRDVLRQMGELGMFGLRVPEEHGGLGMGMLASAAFSEALGASTFAGLRRHRARPHRHGRAAPRQLRLARAARALAARRDVGRDDPVDRRQRARRRLRRGRHPHDRQEGRRRLADQRHQDVHHQRRLRRHDDRRRARPTPTTSTASRCSSCRPTPRASPVVEEARQARLALLATPPSWCSTTSGSPTTSCSARRTAASTRR